MMLINVRMTVSRFAWSLLANFFRVCLMSTLITMANTTRLKSMMIRIGPRKALKNVAVLERKQLEKGMQTKVIYYTTVNSLCSHTYC